MSMKEYNKNQRRASTRQQADNYDKSGIDPFSRAPAGYGLTQAPGKWPWDNPPEIVDVDDAFENIKKRMMLQRCLTFRCLHISLSKQIVLA